MAGCSWGRVLDVKVDDLLANIRKSVDSDFESLSGGTTSQARGTLMRGALREMRISMGVEPQTNPAPVEDVSDMRSRIKQKVEQAAIERFETPLPSRANVPVRGDFSGILSRPSLPPRDQGLRPSFADRDDRDDVRYAPLPPPSQWPEEEQDYGNYVEPDPYAQQTYGYEQPYAPPALEAPLLSRQSEAQTETAFRQLSDALLARATGDRSLEEMTRDMLRTMLKQWLDANLPTIVEEMVREEIQRVARRGR
jgi:cell pole-organizing protein PopZ